MKKFVIIFLSTSLMWLSCNGHKNSHQFLAVDHPRYESLDSLITEYVELYRPIGFVIGIIDKGKIIYTKGFGVRNIEEQNPVTPASVFHMASISKLVATIGIMQLSEKGHVSIDSRLFTISPISE